LQKIAQQLSDAAFLVSDPVETERLAREALIYAERAAQLDPNSAVNRLSLAVLYGRLAGYEDVGKKVEYARLIKQEAEVALGLEPNYAWADHVLGRWHREMSEIGGTRRIIASLFFGGLSRASNEEAVELLERAVELEPDSVAHRVELGFAYAADGRDELAREQWQSSLELTTKRLYDPAAKNQALKALGAAEVGRLNRSKGFSREDSLSSPGPPFRMPRNRNLNKHSPSSAAAYDRRGRRLMPPKRKPRLVRDRTGLQFRNEKRVGLSVLWRDPGETECDRDRVGDLVLVLPGLDAKIRPAYVES
jgi:tetratricopeptide (TPR) repeat protein